MNSAVFAKIPFGRAFALAGLLAATLAVLACASDEPAATIAPAASDATATSPVPRSTPTAQPPKTLRLVRGYNPESFPPFTLPRADGGELNSQDYIGKQPVVVVFYRGNF